MPISLSPRTKGMAGKWPVPVDQESSMEPKSSKMGPLRMSQVPLHRSTHVSDSAFPLRIGCR
jgi:hypothetical protein